MSIKFTHENYEFECNDFEMIHTEESQTNENDLLIDKNLLKFYGRVNYIVSRTGMHTSIIHSDYFCLSPKSSDRIQAKSFFSSKYKEY